MMTLSYTLLAVSLLAALCAVESRRLRLAIAAFGVSALAACLLYIALGSWDLAIFQLAVEIGLLVYLAFSTGSQNDQPGLKGNLFNALAALAFAAVLAGFSYLIFRNWPSVFVASGGWNLPGTLELTGLAAALFAAVVGALTVLRPEDEK